jgi:hypothetical protein
MKLLRCIFVVAGLIAGLVSVHAEDKAAKTLEAFYGTCLSYGPDFDRTKAAATFFKWKALPPEALTMLAPAQAPDRFEGWRVEGEGYPEKTVVAVTTGHLDGEPIRTCTMAVVGVDGKNVEKLFLSRLRARKTGEKSDGMQETRIYRVITGVQEAEQIVSLSMVTPVDGEPVTVLSTMMYFQ